MFKRIICKIRGHDFKQSANYYRIICKRCGVTEEGFKWDVIRGAGDTLEGIERYTKGFWRTEVKPGLETIQEKNRRQQEDICEAAHNAGYPPPFIRRQSFDLPILVPPHGVKIGGIDRASVYPEFDPKKHIRPKCARIDIDCDWDGQKCSKEYPDKALCLHPCPFSDRKTIRLEDGKL